MKKTPGVPQSPRLRLLRGTRRWREPAAVEASKCNELLGKLREAVEAGNAADVLADVLPELTSEVSGIESAFGDIQAANVGLKDQADTLKDQYLRLNAGF